MQELINNATDFLAENYIKPVHTVAAALETSSGKVYLGKNIDHFSGSICAELSALASAMNAGEKSFAKIAAVRMNDDGVIGVVNACGRCRQVLHDYAPSLRLAVLTGGKVLDLAIEEVLPYAFTRQQQKIQNALAGKTMSEVIG